MLLIFKNDFDENLKLISAVPIVTILEKYNYYGYINDYYQNKNINTIK